MKAVCTRCGTEYGEVDLRNHDGETKIINAVAATCVENGYSGDIYCLSCNSLVSSGSETPLAEHTVGDWLSDADGHWHHCSVCDSDVDRGEHRFIWRVTKKATSAENGLKEELCSVCGYKSGKSETIEYAGYEPDDINNDGVVNNQDIARLFQYLSGWGVPVNNRAIDVNKDGNVNNQDLVFLFQALSGWEVDLV
ncbi:MAG: hypothetical protein J5659_03890 [Clostridia bacterium]|nr:hypothetical protein [Clostridia bacterium]